MIELFFGDVLLNLERTVLVLSKVLSGIAVKIPCDVWILPYPYRQDRECGNGSQPAVLVKVVANCVVSEVMAVEI